MTDEELAISGVKFVNRIDSLLSVKGMTRKDLGKMLGLSSSTMGSWKSRNIFPPIETICKIADFFNVSIDWLVTGKNSKINSEKEKNTQNNIKLKTIERIKEELSLLESQIIIDNKEN